MWPLVTRHRFVRELTSQGEAYRANLQRAEDSLRRANQLHEEERTRFVQIVNDLTYYKDLDGHHQLESVYSEDPQNFPVKMMTIHRHHYTDSTDFVVRVTNFLLNRAYQRLSQEDLRFLYHHLAAGFAQQLMLKGMNGEVR